MLFFCYVVTIWRTVFILLNTLPHTVTVQKPEMFSAYSMYRTNCSFSSLKDILRFSEALQFSSTIVVKTRLLWRFRSVLNVSLCFIFFNSQACIDENVELVELLVNNDAFLDARDDEGWTPLHAAASAGNVEIAQ